MQVQASVQAEGGDSDCELTLHCDRGDTRRRLLLSPLRKASSGSRRGAGAAEAWADPETGGYRVQAAAKRIPCAQWATSYGKEAPGWRRSLE